MIRVRVMSGTACVAERQCANEVEAMTALHYYMGNYGGMIKLGRCSIVIG